MTRPPGLMLESLRVQVGSSRTDLRWSLRSRWCRCSFGGLSRLRCCARLRYAHGPGLATLPFRQEVAQTAHVEVTGADGADAVLMQSEMAAALALVHDRSAEDR